MTTTEAPTLDLLPDGEAVRLSQRVLAERLTLEPSELPGEFVILAHRRELVRIVGYIFNSAPKRNKRPRWTYSPLTAREWPNCDFGEYQS